jgi:adenine-specific DNA-methyltransferase
MILENLKTAGVQQAHKEDQDHFTSLYPWPGDWSAPKAKYTGRETEKRAAIFIGPEFGTVQRADLVSCRSRGRRCRLRCAHRLRLQLRGPRHGVQQAGPHPVLKARMNADLHMAEDLKNTGKGNLFVIFGEPDITLSTRRTAQARVKVNGVDVFTPDRRSPSATAPTASPAGSSTPTTTKKASSSATPTSSAPTTPKALKTTLKAEINQEAWAPSTAIPPALSTSQKRPHRREGHQPPRGRGDEIPSSRPARAG